MLEISHMLSHHMITQQYLSYINYMLVLIEVISMKEITLTIFQVILCNII